MDHCVVLVERYKSMVNYYRPDVKPIKNPNGSLELSHILWMLNKMSSPDYVPKTTSSAWISWIQASLFINNIIDVKHEIDITREILKQKEIKHEL